MLTKKLPETNEERINILRAALDQEEIVEEQDRILSMAELRELRLFTTMFEGEDFVLNQAIIDKDKSKKQYDDLFNNAQMYVSHFIQVLLLTVIRNEIKADNLALYGFQGNNPALPNLSTEEAVLKWGENLIKGETNRVNRGGIPLYNPAIAKLKVHYELFKEAIYSLAMYDKNFLRFQTNMKDICKKADNYILDIWRKVEEHYQKHPANEQSQAFKAYNITYIQQNGGQLSVFD